MRAVIEINYVSLGGFKLETDLTEAEVQEVKDTKQLRRRLMGRDESLEVTPMEVSFINHQTDRVSLKATNFAGSNKLPDPSLFKEHMADYKANGWRLVKDSEEGLFHCFSRFKAAIQPTFREKLSKLWSGRV